MPVFFFIHFYTNLYIRTFTFLDVLYASCNIFTIMLLYLYICDCLVYLWVCISIRIIKKSGHKNFRTSYIFTCGVLLVNCVKSVLCFFPWLSFWEYNLFMLPVQINATCMHIASKLVHFGGMFLARCTLSFFFNILETLK